MQSIPALAESAGQADKGRRRWHERYWWVVLVAIVVLGAALRYRGLAWDDGQHLHPDERFLTMVESAIKLPHSLGEYLDTAHSPLSPYNNGFGLFIYGTAPLFFVRLVAELLHRTDYNQVYLLGRGLSALSDLFCLLMVFAIGRRLYDLRTGLLAAFLYALAVFPIQLSHYFTVDTFANVPLMLAFWFTLDIAEGRRGLWGYVLTGVFVGLILASRVNLALYAGVVGLAALFRLQGERQDLPSSWVEHAAGALSRVFGALSRAPTTEAQHMPVPTPTRTRRFGPLLFEISYEGEGALVRQGAPVAPLAVDIARPIALRVQSVVIGLVLAAAAALLVFRLAQPYAFSGLFSLNPQFLDNLAMIGRQVSGQDDIPPGQQWAFRTPYWFSWSNMVLWGLGPALGLAAWAGVALAAWQVLRQRRSLQALMFVWALATFLYYGNQFVMTMRYLQPLYPFLAIFAASFLFAMSDRLRALARNRTSGTRTLLRAAVVGLFGIVIGYTLFWALAFTSIYTRTTTRVAASRWILANIPDNAVIADEHWDDALPLRVDGSDYFAKHQGVQLALYDEDTPEKRADMVGWMDQSDYIILSSNRLTDSILRLPMRYPLTTRYYEWLFNGQLGFEKVKEFTSYPQLFDFAINDDSAEEQFTVYDHPKVVILRKAAAYSHEKTVALFNIVDLTDVLRLKPIDATASRNQFQLDAADSAANALGGTWSDIFNANDLANEFPVPVWTVMVLVLGLLAWPFTFVLFRGFTDRGYAFAKALGILAVAWFPWILSSTHVLPFGRASISFGMGILLVTDVLIVWQHRAELQAYLDAHLRLLAVEELLFFGFFAIDLVIRYGNPDLWHPSFGGEKPMDFAYLNAIIKTTWFPPYNPWFAGDYINYYYFGQYVSAMLIRLSGIVPDVAYNLLLPTFFALTASGAFAVAFNLVMAATRSESGEEDDPGGVPFGAELSSRTAIAKNLFFHKRDPSRQTMPLGVTKPHPARTVPNYPRPLARSFRLPIAAGLFAACLVVIMGNLGEFELLVKGLTSLGGGSGVGALLVGVSQWWSGSKDIPVALGDWYWTATRVIPDTINEFPFFTFLYADLHAHLVALPYTLLALGVSTHLLLSRARIRWYDLGIFALVLGTLHATNTWDYPTYLALGGAALVIRVVKDWEDTKQDELDSHVWVQQWLQFATLVLVQITLFFVPLTILGLSVTFDVGIYIGLLLFSLVLAVGARGLRLDQGYLAEQIGWPVLFTIAASYVLFLPYVLNYATAYSSAELWQQARTSLPDYLTVFGIFIFLVATFFAVTLWRQSQLSGDSAWKTLSIWAPWVAVVLITLALFQQWVFALLVPLVAAGAWITWRAKADIGTRWTGMLLTAALLLTAMVDVINLKGDVGRRNTVFKFYLQAWVLLGVAGASGLGVLLVQPSWLKTRAHTSPAGPLPQEAEDNEPAPLRAPGPSSGPVLRRVWWGALGLLVALGLLYPFFATWAKVKDRYVPNSPSGLNGIEFTQGATYGENNQTFALRGDYDAILWIRENIKGSAVIAEANTGLYHWGARFSIYTGLPTIVGWDWHTKQQYSLLPGDQVDRRVQTVKDLYNSPDPAVAAAILQRYHVSYVIVGALERAVYSPAGLQKFQGMADSGVLKRVYDSNDVKIYQVASDAAPWANR